MDCLNTLILSQCYTTPSPGLGKCEREEISPIRPFRRCSAGGPCLASTELGAGGGILWGNAPLESPRAAGKTIGNGTVPRIWGLGCSGWAIELGCSCWPQFCGAGTRFCRWCFPRRARCWAGSRFVFGLGRENRLPFWASTSGRRWKCLRIWQSWARTCWEMCSAFQP